MSDDKPLVNYDEELAKLAKLASQVEKPAGSSVGCRAGILTLNGTQVPENKLDVIIIASTYANLYYDEEFDADNPRNPICFAYSEDGENMAPHIKSSHMQHENCDTCPWNQWKSDPKTHKGKACKNTRILVMIPASTKPEDIPIAEAATFKLPVTSVKGWGMYVDKLNILHHRPPLGITTQIGIVPDLKTQFKITFKDTGFVNNDCIPALIARLPAALEMTHIIFDPNPELSDEEKAKAAKPKKY